MLNIYNYYDTPDTLPLYDGIHDKLWMLNHSNRWGRAIPAKDLEPLIGIIIRKPESAFYYARGVIGGRWPEAEPTIMKDAGFASWYAEFILRRDPEWTSQEGHENGRWPEAESTIMKDPFTAFLYAKRILQHRWEEAEPDIKTDPNYWEHYKEHFGLE